MQTDPKLEVGLVPQAPATPRLPVGACDCHAHVFGPFDEYQLAEPRSYLPPHAPGDAYLAMLDGVGYGRGVLVHGGAHGWDHAAMLHTLRSAPERLRGIGVAARTVSDAELTDLHDAGVRGLRFTDTTWPKTAAATPGRVGLDELWPLALRLQTLGWHAQVWANADLVHSRATDMSTLAVPVVLDHMGFFDRARGVADPAFQTLLAIVRDGNVWVKLTPLRVSDRRPPGDLADVRVFQEALIEAAPDRMLWGSDWPFIGMTGDSLPQPNESVERFAAWVGDELLLKRILVSNPERLYGIDAS